MPTHSLRIMRIARWFCLHECSKAGSANLLSILPHGVALCSIQNTIELLVGVSKFVK